ncbi:hypothetical protein BH10ACI4_BH10ACI4_07730 [soil metagenome]
MLTNYCIQPCGVDGSKEVARTNSIWGFECTLDTLRSLAKDAVQLTARSIEMSLREARRPQWMRLP